MKGRVDLDVLLQQANYHPYHEARVRADVIACIAQVRSSLPSIPVPLSASHACPARILFAALRAGCLLW